MSQSFQTSMPKLSQLFENVSLLKLKQLSMKAIQVYIVINQFMTQLIPVPQSVHKPTKYLLFARCSVVCNFRPSIEQAQNFRCSKEHRALSQSQRRNAIGLCQHKLIALRLQLYGHYHITLVLKNVNLLSSPANSQ